jgi:hypothetical protein
MGKFVPCHKVLVTSHVYVAATDVADETNTFLLHKYILHNNLVVAIVLPS